MWVLHEVRISKPAKVFVKILTQLEKYKTMARLRYIMATTAAVLITAFYLKRLLGAYSIIVPLLFMFVDVSYSLRVLWMMLRQVTTRRLKGVQFEDPLKMTEVYFYVLPSDLDIFLHMNNSRYLRECDFGRYNHWIISGVWAEIKKHHCYLTLGASTIRYRKSLELGDRVRLQSKIIYWDQKAFYVEQRFINEENFICAIVIVKQSVVRLRGRESVTPHTLLEALLRKPVVVPAIPPELECWLEYNTASSDRLKEERNKTHCD